MIFKNNTAVVSSVLDVQWCLRLLFYLSTTEKFAEYLDIVLVLHLVPGEGAATVDSSAVAGYVGVFDHVLMQA